MRLYLDTMVWIYALENHPEFGTKALLVPHVRRRDQFTIAAYRRMMLASPAHEVIPFTTETAMHFAALRAHHRVK